MSLLSSLTENDMRDAGLDAEDSRSEVYVRDGNKANVIRTRGLQGRSEYVN